MCKKHKCVLLNHGVPCHGRLSRRMAAIRDLDALRVILIHESEGTSVRQLRIPNIRHSLNALLEDEPMIAIRLVHDITRCTAVEAIVRWSGVPERSKMHTRSAGKA